MLFAGYTISQFVAIANSAIVGDLPATLALVHLMPLGCNTKCCLLMSMSSPSKLSLSTSVGVGAAPLPSPIAPAPNRYEV